MSEPGPGPVAYVIAGVIVAVILYIFCWITMRFLCCTWRVGRWTTSPVFWVVRRLFSRKNKHPPHLCKSQKRGTEGRRFCQKERLLLHSNSLAPYCRDCYRTKKTLRPLEAQLFENSRYPWIEQYPQRKCDPIREIKKELQQAKSRKSSGSFKPGYIYIYVSTFDLDAKRIQPEFIAPEDLFIYKIGMTTRTPRKRINEQEGAVFLSGTREGVKAQDWFKVSDADSAEQIAHALLCDVRVRRFDQDESSWEKEWFTLSYERAIRAMQKAAFSVNQGVLDYDETWEGF